MAATPLNRGAKKISSLFSAGASRDDCDSILSHSSTSSHLRGSSQDLPRAGPASNAPLPKSASLSNFPGPRTNTPLNSHEAMPPPISTLPLSPLAPPPTLVNYGPPKPASSHGSVRSRPSSRAGSREGSRSRPSTPTMMAPPGSASSPVSRTQIPPRESKISKRQSWLPKRPGQGIEESGNYELKAWISGLREHIPYDMSPIFRGERISELWNDKADTFIHLFPPKFGRGPSFKVASSLFSSSRTLTHISRRSSRSSQDLNRLSMDSRALNAATQQLSINDRDGYLSPRGSARGRSNSSTGSSASMRLIYDFEDESTQERHLYMPLELESDLSIPNSRLTSDDMELLILYRNFFAFLAGGALVATPRQSTLYSIFLGIGSILARFEFSNLDGSTFGEVVSSSFTRYCDELRLADVRASREKTIEAIVLGEKMKAWSLYNEGFVHGAGKLSHMKSLNSPKYAQISPVTRNRLERAALDLDGRIRTIQTKLDDFEFPSMFAGIANSQMAVEARMIRFKSWKAAFFGLRKHVIAYYRQRYGAWPPKAKSKKNNFEESGLNRLLLREVYQDFTDLYDMLADRTQLTNRTIDMAAPDDNYDFNDTNESITHAIRRVESEYDRCTPPVQPPIPFDTPLFPSLSTSFHRGHVIDPSKDAKDGARRLRDNEVNELLLGSYNRESMKATPFLEDFLRLERRSGHGCTVGEIVDTRCGQWIFMYAVLQSLPMVVVDARDVHFSQGVEYFLCVPPRGGRPWMKEDTFQSRSWYNVASGGGIVNLPADVIDHSVEGIYRRSHCWTIAAQWASASEAMSPATQVSLGASLPPPPVVGGSRVSTQMMSMNPHLSPALNPVRDPVPNTAQNRQSRSFSFGLEALPLPPGIAPDGSRSARPISVHDPSKTFDSILAGVQPSAKKGKK